MYLFFLKNSTLPTLKNWNKTDKNNFKPTNCTSLVSLPSVLNNTWNINITKYLRGLSYLNKFTLGILIAILLGDASISIKKMEQILE